MFQPKIIKQYPHDEVTVGGRKCLRGHRRNAGETWVNDRQGERAVPVVVLLAGDAVLEQTSQLRKLKNDSFKPNELCKPQFKFYLAALKSTKSNPQGRLTNHTNDHYWTSGWITKSSKFVQRQVRMTKF